MKSKILFIVILGILIQANNLFSESLFFGLSKPDVSKFPLVSSSFTATQASGTYFDNIVNTDFIIKENGRTIPAIDVSVDCVYDAPIEYLLMIDNSGSMNDFIDGRRKMDWVILGANFFIDNLPMNNQSSIAIANFNASPKLRCDFTDDKQALKDSLSKIGVVTAPTDFNNAFLEKPDGGLELMKQRPIDKRRVIIFLTDGRHNDTRGAFKTLEIIDELRTNNINCFTITFLDTVKNEDLSAIAAMSGGTYEYVASTDNLNSVLSQIGYSTRSKPVCLVTWKSNLSCDPVELFRNLDVTFKRIPGQPIAYQYTAPQWSIFRIQTDQQVYDFANPAPGASEERFITLQPNLDVSITDFLLIPSTYFEILDYGNNSSIKPTDPITIKAGETRTLKVRFTQGSPQQPRFSILYLEATPCPLEIPLVGGQKQMIITNPKAGDVLSACDFIDINWTGVDSTELVKFYYTTDNGSQWFKIVDDVQGGTYRWTPPIANAKYKIRGVVTYQQTYKWAVSDGGVANESVTSIDAQNNELFCVVSGNYDDTTNIDGNKLLPKGGKDMFVAKYDADGKMRWIRSAGSKNDDNAAGTCIDPIGNVYLTGKTFNEVQFESQSYGLTRIYAPHIFLAKYSTFGNFLKCAFVVPYDGSESFESYAEYIKYVFDGVNEPRIIIRGKYKGSYFNSDLGLYLNKVANWTDFTCEFNPSLMLTNIYNGYTPPNTGYSSKNKSFPTGTIFETDNFSGSKNIGGYVISDINGQDGSTPKKGFPHGTVIPSKGFYVFATDDAKPSAFDLSDYGEKVWLENSLGDIIDTITYPKLKATQSYGRSPDGDNWKVLDSITRGNSNSSTTAKIGGLVMNEIYSNGTVDDPDWIELYNSSTSSLDLSGFDLASNGGTDYWISKKSVDARNEYTTAEFEIVVPQLELKYNFIGSDSIGFHNDSSYIDLGSAYINDAKTVVLDSILTNRVKLPVMVVDYKLTGLDPTSFDIDKTYLNIPINQDEITNFGVIFNPVKKGLCKATLELIGNCGSSVFLDLYGKGLCHSDAKDTIRFASMLVAEPTTKIISATFYNPMVIPVKIRPIIDSDIDHKQHWRDFVLISPEANVQITVDPFTEVEFTIKFTPSALGERQAYINYNIDAGCEVLSTILVGYGIIGTITSNSLNFGKERLNYNFPTQDFKIKNLGNTTKTVTEIQYSNVNLQSTFQMPQIQMPFNIAGKDSAVIPITFIPQNDIFYSTDVKIITSEADTTVSLFEGETYLPMMITDKACADNIKVGSSGIAYVDLTNPSTSSQLSVNSISLTNNNEFAFQLGIINNVTLQKGESKRFLIDYTPQAGFNHNTDVLIEADDYDGLFTDLWKTTTISIICDALKFEYTIPFFGPTLLCNDNEKFISITNTSEATQAEIYVDQSQILGQDQTAFMLNSKTPQITIAGGETIQIPVIFTPTEPRKYSARVTIPASNDINFDIPLSGEGREIIPTTTPAVSTILPNETQTLSFIADIPDLEKGSIDSLEFIIRTSNTAIYINPNTFKSSNPAITWSPIALTAKGDILVKGKGNLVVPFKNELFTFKYTGMLDDSLRTSIFYDVRYACTERKFDVKLVKIDKICLEETRRIIVTDYNYSVAKPAPNPVDNEFNLDFSLALDSYTQIDIYNMLGKKVKTLFGEELKAGNYEMKFPATDLPSGSYIIKFQSGRFAKALPLQIVK